MRQVSGQYAFACANSHAEYGPLRVVSYPTAPFGLITERLNDFRSNTIKNPCLPRRA